jgi:hypothetical protein
VEYRRVIVIAIRPGRYGVYGLAAAV